MAAKILCRAEGRTARELTAQHQDPTSVHTTLSRMRRHGYLERGTPLRLTAAGAAAALMSEFGLTRRRAQVLAQVSRAFRRASSVAAGVPGLHPKYVYRVITDLELLGLVEGRQEDVTLYALTERGQKAQATAAHWLALR